jgi:hypothetical protein
MFETVLNLSKIIVLFKNSVSPIRVLFRPLIIMDSLKDEHNNASLSIYIVKVDLLFPSQKKLIFCQLEMCLTILFIYY